MNDPHHSTAVEPCPFCGHQGVTVYKGDTYCWRIASCDKCGAQAPDVRHTIKEGQTPEQAMADTNKRALEAWNTRA